MSDCEHRWQAMHVPYECPHCLRQELAVSKKISRQWKGVLGALMDAKSVVADQDQLERGVRELLAERDSARTENEQLRSALAELVACKDLADQRDYNLLYAQTTGSLKKAKELDTEYRSRKNDAWRAARAALAGKEQP